MEQSGTSKRFQPYARPRATARRQQAPPAVQEYPQNIPTVIVNFLKSTLNFLGITGNDRDALDKELNTTNGDFEILPDAHRDGRNGGEGNATLEERKDNLYPDLGFTDDLREKETDLRFYIDAAKSMNKRPAMDQPGRMSSSQRHKLMRSLQGSQSEDNSMESSQFAVDDELPFSADNEDEKSHHAVSTVEPEVTEAGLMEEEDDLAGLLSPAELRLLGRMRQVTEAPFEKARKNSLRRQDTRILEETLRRDHPTAYSVIRRAHQEDEPASKPSPRPLDTIMPYNKEYRRQRVTRAPTLPVRETMDIGSGGSDADESEPPKNDEDDDDTHHRTFSTSHTPRRSEVAAAAAAAITTAAAAAAASAVHHHNKHQRTSRGGFQIKSQVTPERHVRSIPGRFSALDSDDEEEALRQYDQEKHLRQTQHSQNVTPVTYGLGHSETRGINGNQVFPGFRVPPQLYPTLNYGQRTRLYHPRLEETLKWTSSPITNNKCDTCQGKPVPSTSGSILESEPRVSFALSPAQTTASATSAVSATSATSAAGSLFGIKDDSASKIADKPTEAKSAAPSLFTPSFGGASTVPPMALSTGKGNEAITKATTAPVTTAGASIWGPATDSGDKWKCPTCDVKNKNELDKCPCCETAKPGTKKTPAPSLFGPPSTTPSTSGTAPSLFPPVVPSASTTSTASPAAPLFTFGGSSSTSTDTSKAPAAAPLFGGFAAPSASSAAKPAAAPALFGAPSTSTAAPPAASTVAGSSLTTASIWGAAPTDDKWKCPTCDVRNKPEDTKCPCCDTAKPGAPAASAAATPVPASSLFGFKPPVATSSASSAPLLLGGFKPTATAATTPSSTSASTTAAVPAFGGFTPSLSTSAAPATPSLFGAPSTAAPAATTAESSKPPIFSFGASGDAKEKAPPSFTFGSASSATPSSPATTTAASAATATPSTANPFAPASSASSPFVFGAAPASTSTTEEPKKITAPTFSFGASGTTTSPTPLFGAASTTSTSSPFGSTITATPAPPLFGATSTAAPSISFGSTTSTFGAGAPATSAPLFGAGAAATASPFGASTGASSAPSFGSSSVTTAPSTTSMFGSSTSAPMSTPSFGAAPTTATATPMFGSTSNSPSTFTFGAGASSGGGFSGFGSSSAPTANAANSMMSPPMTHATPAVSTATPSFTFGSGPVAFGASSTPAFGASAAPGFGASAAPAFGASAAPAFGASATPAFGAAATPAFGVSGTPAFGASGTPAFGASAAPAFGSSAAPAFGASAGSGFGGSASGSQTASFGQSGFGSGQSSMNSGGFGQSNGGTGFGGFGSGASATPSTSFGAQGSNGGSFVTLANNTGTGFGAPGGSSGFGGPMGAQQGSFGFGGGATAPGGPQYQQQQSAMGAGGAAPGGGFAFHVGAAPAETSTQNRKIAKMRKKRG